MGIFSGLEALGFKIENRKIYEEPVVEKQVEEEIPEKKETTIVEEDVLFPKSYSCPVCGKGFKSLAVRAGKVRNIGQDDDLRPKYNGMDPIKYDAIVCPHCGYGAIARYFQYVMPVQGKKLRAEVKRNFRGIEHSKDVYSYEEAFLNYKIVLMCDVIGGVISSRKAYTCLKMAWLLRGWLEAEGDTLSEAKKKELEENYKESIQHAYDGYVKAFSVEAFPISGMDEMTTTYLLAQLAFQTGDYSNSLKMLVNVIMNKGVSAKIKDKALVLKEEIRKKLVDTKTDIK